jgi:hypothetical protein
MTYRESKAAATTLHPPTTTLTIMRNLTHRHTLRARLGRAGGVAFGLLTVGVA